MKQINHTKDIQKRQYASRWYEKIWNRTIAGYRWTAKDKLNGTWKIENMEIEKAYGLGGNKQLSCKITVAQLSRKEQGKGTYSCRWRKRKPGDTQIYVNFLKATGKVCKKIWENVEGLRAQNDYVDLTWLRAEIC